MGSLRCHPYPYLRTKVVNLRRNFLGHCPRIDPTFSRRFNIGINLVDKIEMYLAASSNITTKFGSLTAALPKKVALMPLSLRNASISAKNVSGCVISIQPVCSAAVFESVDR